MTGSKHRRLIWFLAFGLMLVGVSISLWGQSIQANSYRALSISERDQLIITTRSSERERAHILKNTGVVLVIAGAIIWLLGGFVPNPEN